MKIITKSIQTKVKKWLNNRLNLEREILERLEKLGFVIGGYALFDSKKVRIDNINITHDFEYITFDFIDSNGYENQADADYFKPIKA